MMTSSTVDCGREQAGASSSRFLAFAWFGRCQLWDIEPGHAMRDLIRLTVVKVRQNHHRQLVIHIAGDVAVEALPLAFVLDHAVSPLLVDKPSETVAAGIGL